METVVVAIDESKFAQYALKCKYTSALYAFIVYNVFKFIKMYAIRCRNIDYFP